MPFGGSLDYLHVVDAHYALSINVDQLLVEHITSKQDLAFASRERPQIQNVRIQPHAVLTEMSDAPT